jgi:hypothetical protein
MMMQDSGLRYPEAKSVETKSSPFNRETDTATPCAGFPKEESSTVRTNHLMVFVAGPKTGHCVP